MHLNNYYDINTAYDYDFTAYYHNIYKANDYICAFDIHDINKAYNYHDVCSANHDNISSARNLYEFNKADDHNFCKHHNHIGCSNYQHHHINYYRSNSTKQSDCDSKFIKSDQS
jgi:hypothetical protein